LRHDFRTRLSRYACNNKRAEPVERRSALQDVPKPPAMRTLSCTQLMVRRTVRLFNLSLVEKAAREFNGREPEHVIGRLNRTACSFSEQLRGVV
jgi:hypothetical protein